MIDGLKPYPAIKDSGLPWLGNVPAHWEVKKLRQCGSIAGGLTPSMADRSLWDGDVPWVTPKDMKRFTIAAASMNVCIAADRHDRAVPRGRRGAAFRDEGDGDRPGGRRGVARSRSSAKRDL